MDRLTKASVAFRKERPNSTEAESVAFDMGLRIGFKLAALKMREELSGWIHRP